MNLIDHAEHNKSASLYLNKSDSFPDWVIITAYYSALKFAEWSLFPYESEGKIYNTFNKMYREKLSKEFNPFDPTEKLTKHTELKKLIHSDLSEVYDQYNWLYSTCMNARYNSNSKYNKSLAQKAIEYLEEFQHKCKENDKVDVKDKTEPKS